MPYIVTNSDGTLTVTVSDNTVDTASYSLALVGRSVSNYGQYFAQNTIRHLENFASATAPSVPLTGQIWYDKTEQVVRVYDGVYWKRTGIVVGADNQKPTTQLAGGGTAFFNTTNNKLEVHNGTRFTEAAYGGEVTSRYSSDTSVNSPTFYGTRLRTLFLNGTPAGGGATVSAYPVLALTHVKSSADGTPRQGITEIGEQRETIMALWSDFNFIIDSNTQTPVDGQVVNYYSELTEADFGIAYTRPGRILGEIKQGMNTRSEYEDTSVLRADKLYVNQIGDAGNVVLNAYFQDVDIAGVLDVSSLNVDNDITANGSITVDGDITAATGIGTFANIVVTAGAELNGHTFINGNLTVNGVNTQSIGTDSEKIENAYFNVIDTQSITVDGTGSISNLSVTGSLATFVPDITMLGDANIDLSSGQLNGAATQVLVIDDSASTTTQYVTFVNATSGKEEIRIDDGFTYEPDTGNLTIAGFLNGTANQVNVTNDSTAATNHYLAFVEGDSGGSETVKVDTGLLYVPSTGTLNSTIFDGVATSAQYADLAEIYAADAELGPGTVVMIGGSAEVTACDTDACVDVFGVVSTDPAYLMNSKAEGVPVALQGRVPVKVVGPCSKGDRLVSSGVAGYARAIGSTSYDPRMVVGRALANKTDEGQGTVEAVIGVK